MNFSGFNNSVGDTVSDVKNQFNIEMQKTDSSTDSTNQVDQTEQKKDDSVEIDKLLEESKKRAEQEGVVK